MKAYTYKASYLYMLPNRFEESMQVLTKALEINPNCSGCYYTKGLLLNGEDAIENLSKAIELDDKDFDAFYTRAQNFRNLNGFESAVNDFSRAISLNKNMIYSHSILTERAACYLELFDFDSALIDINLALEIDSADANAYYTRMYYYIKAGNDFENALKDYEKCKKLGVDGLDSNGIEMLDALFDRYKTMKAQKK